MTYIVLGIGACAAIGSFLLPKGSSAAWGLAWCAGICGVVTLVMLLAS